MSDYSKLSNTINSCQNSIHNNLVANPHGIIGGVKYSLLARGAYLALVPLSFATTALDTIFGVGLAAVAIPTCGYFPSLNKLTFKYVSQSTLLLCLPYTNLLKAINPDIKPDWTQKKAPKKAPKRMISHQGIGFVSSFTTSRLKEFAESQTESTNKLQQRLLSRVAYGALVPASIIGRGLDAVIGVGAVALSILALGKSANLNNLAYRSLQFTGVIDDVAFFSLKALNPFMQMQH